MSLFKQKITYLDGASGAMLLSSALKAMKSLIYPGNMANPASLHALGLQANIVVHQGRESIAKTIGAHTDEIIFTGSGTESIALAIMGTVYAAQKTIPLPHVITSTIEHSAVLNTCRLLEDRGDATVTYIDPSDTTGKINMLDVIDAVTDNTVLISIHLTNSEIGIIQAVEELVKLVDVVKEKKYNITRMRFSSKSFYPYIHVDACQAYAHIDLTHLVRGGIDLISFNSSKIGGPSGIAALYKRRSAAISPLYGGGDQEMGLRPGTISPLLVHGFHTASQFLARNREKNEAHYTELKKYFILKLEKLMLDTGFSFMENSSTYSIPSIVSISFPYFTGQQFSIELDARGIAVSSKSACNTEDVGESRIIQEIRNINQEAAYINWGTVRISFSPDNTFHDIDRLLKAIKDIVNKYQGVLY